VCILQLRLDGIRAETIFRLSAKRTSPCDSAGAAVQSTTEPRCAGQLVAFVLCCRGYVPRSC
jgi:hypothetical protein